MALDDEELDIILDEELATLLDEELATLLDEELAMLLRDEEPTMLLGDEELIILLRDGEPTKEPDEEPMNIGDDDILEPIDGEPPLLPVGKINKKNVRISIRSHSKVMYDKNI